MAYSICYGEANIMIHLGDYSRKRMSEKYSNAKHIVIPHHVYNKLYSVFPEREESIRKLRLDEK